MNWDRFAAFNEIQAHEKLTGPDKAVIIAIWGHADERGVAYPGKAKLCSESGFKMTTVKQAIRAGQKQGVFSVHRRPREDKDWDTNIYRFDLGRQTTYLGSETTYPRSPHDPKQPSEQPSEQPSVSGSSSPSKIKKSPSSPSAKLMGHSPSTSSIGPRVKQDQRDVAVQCSLITVFEDDFECQCGNWTKNLNGRCWQHQKDRAEGYDWGTQGVDDFCLLYNVETDVVPGLSLAVDSMMNKGYSPQRIINYIRSKAA